MTISFHFYCSYQNEVEYLVSGHAYVKRIEAYSECRHGLLDYQRQSFNGNSDEFERIMVARQGGVLVRYVDKPYRDTPTYWADHRFPQELYLAFVQWRKDEHAKYLLEHEKRRVSRGYTNEEYPLGDPDPLPRPMFYNPESLGYEVEPWFQPEMASWEPTDILVAA
jgi:hypothetical protein